MTSFSLGVSYLLAVYQRNRAYMAAAPPLRFLATVVLSSHGGEWRKVAVYEAAMGLLTTVCLLWREGGMMRRGRRVEEAEGAHYVY